MEGFISVSTITKIKKYNDTDFFNKETTEKSFKDGEYVRISVKDAANNIALVNKLKIMETYE